MATEEEYGASQTNSGGDDWFEADNALSSNNVCAQGSCEDGDNWIEVTLNDPSMSDNPTNCLASVELRYEHVALAAEVGETAILQVARSGQSLCVGHAVDMYEDTVNCQTGLFSNYVTCTHAQRPRTIAEAKGTVVVRLDVSGAQDVEIYLLDSINARYTYFALGTPGAPVTSTPSQGMIRITQPTPPSNSTHWTTERSDTGTGGWTEEDTYRLNSSTTWDDTGLGDGTTRYYRVKFSCTSVGDYSVTSASDNSTTWDVPTVPQNLSVTNV